MKMKLPIRLLVLSCLILAGLISTVSAQENGRNSATETQTVTSIIGQLRRNPIPDPPATTRDDARALAAFEQQVDQVKRTRAELIGQWYAINAEDRRLPRLMIERWLTLGDAAEAQRELIESSARPSDHPLTIPALFVLARQAVEGEEIAAAEAREKVEAFLDQAERGDDRGATLLGLLAVRKYGDDPAEQLLLFNRILATYPRDKNAKIARRMADAIEKEHPELLAAVAEKAEAEPMAQAKPSPEADRIRSTDNDPRVGRAFELTFTNSITGEQVSTEDLKGTVLVIDFWATWCGPCIAEIPEMKRLYEEYHDQGVEFLGISLDRPGDESKLRQFVADRGMPWPQYFQGDEGFASDWGIRAIPTLFLVDRDGTVLTVKARGRLDDLLGMLTD